MTPRLIYTLGSLFGIVIFGCTTSRAPNIDCSVAITNNTGSTDAAGCPIFDSGGTCGIVSNSEIIEASGIVASRKNSNVLWTHNDSGNAPCIFALSTTGKFLGRYLISGATNVDWEDIAMGPGQTAGESYLYIGDIGDNKLARQTINIYRLPEPTVPTTNQPADESVTDFETFTFVYPDGAHNAESLLVDPLNGDVYIVAKSSTGESPVFRAAAPLSSASPMTLASITTLRFGKAPLRGSPLTTGGDILPDGSGLAIRTYDCAYFWWRAPGKTIAEALQTAPCRLPMQPEDQGEAFGFAAEGNGYYSFSEGSSEPLYFYARK